MSRGQNRSGSTAAGAGARPPRGTRRAWSNLATGLFLLPVMAVLLPTTIVLGILMLPTLAAYIAGRGRVPMLGATVGLLNVAGSVPALVELWSLGHSLSAAGEVLGEPLLWFGPYLAAAFGWLVFLSMPPFVQRYYETVTAHRLKALREHQERLREEWGDVVAGEEAAGDGHQAAPDAGGDGKA